MCVGVGLRPTPPSFASTMSLIQRARDCGNSPPSLLSDDRVVNEDGFDSAVLNLLYGNGLTLSSEDHVASDFEQVLKMAEDVLQIPGALDLDKKRLVVEQRRCILLAIIGCSPDSNPAVKAIVSNGFLNVLKSWLDDILNGAIGGMDLLLHLLSSIAELPVTKSTVLDSGMGKAIRDIEKHKICTGTSNEAAIRSRVQEVKDAWNAAVRVNKDVKKTKRPLESSTENSPTSKRSKGADQEKKSSSFSKLLKKVSTTSESRPSGAKSTEAASPVNANGISNGQAAAVEKMVPKKSAKRVKWSDHFGGNLSTVRIVNDDAVESADAPVENLNVSWSDRKKRDRLREKELLAQAKKSKIIDDDKDDDYQHLMLTDRMNAVIPWHPPKLLPERIDITKAQCTSKEILAQTLRKSKVSPVRYLSEEDVPSSPAPMTAVEEALDVASQAAAVMATIPFFSAQQVAPPPAVAPAPALLYSHAPPPMNVGLPPPPPPRMNILQVGAPVVGASADIVQAMGLPLFLVGSNVQALQTLAATPSLLNTFVDANGMYDQSRLMSLVQALSQNLAPSQPVQQIGQTSYGYQQPMASSTYGVSQQTSYQSAVPTSTYGTSLYGTSSSASHYGPASTTTASVGAFRGKSDAGNLHVSGYGPMTTQAELIALFAPYVHVDEVVMKTNFSFVNTSDPDGATRAREALSGALLGGSPIRINPAQRRDPSRAPQPMASIYGGGASAASPAPAVPAPLPSNGVGQIDYASVRDDRGNPATKNLFVAGYGPGTTEQQIRDYFGQHCTVTACVSKGTFSFVNTVDRGQAVIARNALMGTPLNGGSLRINFAKETGRLGTSFDTTYGLGSQSRYGGR